MQPVQFDCCVCTGCLFRGALDILEEAVHFNRLGELSGQSQPIKIHTSHQLCQGKERHPYIQINGIPLSEANPSSVASALLDPSVLMPYERKRPPLIEIHRS